jgi:hypothetical protein
VKQAIDICSSERNFDITSRDFLIADAIYGKAFLSRHTQAHIAHKHHFTLTRVGIAILVLFCVSRIDFQFSSTRSDGASPRELFGGRRIDGTLDLVNEDDFAAFWLNS